MSRALMLKTAEWDERRDNVFDSIDDGIAAIKRGEIIIVVDDENRENEGDLVIAAECVTPEKVNTLITRGRGLPKATAESDVVVTTGGTGTFPYSIEDRQRPTVGVSLVVRTVELELVQRWRLVDKPANVDLAERLACDLPPGDYLWYVYAIGADGAKQPRSQTARLLVRPKGLLRKLSRGRPKPMSDDTDSPGEGGPPELTLGREDD